MTDNNNDVINDILNQLDKEKAESDNNKDTTDDVPDTVTGDNLSDTRDLGRNPVSGFERPENDTEKNAERIAPVRRRIHDEAAPVRRSPSAEEPDGTPPPMHRREPHIQAADRDTVRNAAAVKRNSVHHKKKKKKRRRSRLPGVLILTVFIFAVSICLSLVIIAFGKDVLGIGKDSSTKMIIIPEGATSEDVSQLLYDEGIISSPKCFQLFSRLRNDADNYLAGEHFVSPNMAYETIIKTLTTYEDEEQKEAVTITFIEGVNIFDAADQLQDQGVGAESGDLVAAVDGRVPEGGGEDDGFHLHQAKEPLHLQQAQAAAVLHVEGPDVKAHPLSFDLGEFADVPFFQRIAPAQQSIESFGHGLDTSRL